MTTFVVLRAPKPANKMLTDTIELLPSFRSRIGKDKDFAELQNDERFRALIAKG